MAELVELVEELVDLVELISELVEELVDLVEELLEPMGEVEVEPGSTGLEQSAVENCQPSRLWLNSCLEEGTPHSVLDHPRLPLQNFEAY